MLLLLFPRIAGQALRLPCECSNYTTTGQLPLARRAARRTLIAVPMHDLQHKPRPAAVHSPSSVEVARGLAQRAGLVFLDSAVPGQIGQSLIASAPVEIISGSIFTDAEK